MDKESNPRASPISAVAPNQNSIFQSSPQRVNPEIKTVPKEILHTHDSKLSNIEGSCHQDKKTMIALTCFMADQHSTWWGRMLSAVHGQNPSQANSVGGFDLDFSAIQSIS